MKIILFILETHPEVFFLVSAEEPDVAHQMECREVRRITGDDESTDDDLLDDNVFYQHEFYLRIELPIWIRVEQNISTSTTRTTRISDPGGDEPYPRITNPSADGEPTIIIFKVDEEKIQIVGRPDAIDLLPRVGSDLPT